MFGPKLSARSYAILILAAMGLLMGGNLIAQSRSSAESSAEIASATNAVAAATNRVAESNAQIAAAIKDLASAVRSAGAQRAASSGGDMDMGTSSPSGEEIMLSPGDAKADKKDGVFELK